MTDKKYYVTTTDKFMSGWGRSENLINKLIFICDSFEEALIVEDNARNRIDQKYVSINYSPPKFYRKTKGTDYIVGNYYVQIKTKEDYPAWYRAGYFRTKTLKSW